MVVGSPSYNERHRTDDCSGDDEAVLAAAPHYDTVWNLGDVLGSGANPNEVMWLRVDKTITRSTCCRNLRACLRSPEQQPEEGQVDHLQTGIQLAFAVLP